MATAKHSGTPIAGPGSDRMSTFLQRLALILGGIFFIITSAWYIADQSPNILSLKSNFFGWLSLVSCATSLIAWLLIQRIQERTEAILWFSLHLFSMAFWAVGEALTRFSATPEAAVAWGPLTTIGSVFMPVSLYIFALAYTNSRHSRHPLVLSLFLMVSAVLLLLDFHTNQLTIYDPSQMTLTAWGYVARTGPGYLIIAIWLILLAAISVGILYRFRRRTIDPLLRRQTMLFMVAISLPLIGGGITDGVLPAMNIVAVPPMTVMLVTIMGLLISYGIFKYQIFSFTPEHVASQIIDTMNEAVIGVDSNFQLNYANAGAERLLGYSAQELSRRPLTSILAARTTTKQLQALFAPLQQQSFHSLDSVDLRTASGDPLTAKVSITKVGGSRDSQAFVVVLTDITTIVHASELIERQVASQTRTIRETKAQLDGSINSLELGFIITDDRPEVVVVNRPAHALFCGDDRHTPAECKNVTIEALNHASHKDIRRALERCLKSHKPQQIKLIEFKNRSWRAFITPVVDGKQSNGATILFQDITEEQILARSRDEFFSIASHELRTPLTAIKGGSSMMLQYYADALSDPALHEIVGDIHESSDRLISIVNDFLDASRLEQGRISYIFEAVNLSKIAQQVAKEMEPTVSARGIYVRLGETLSDPQTLPMVIADRNRVKQVMFNLIGNAAKFTAKGGITVDGIQEKGTIRITVADTGQGIAPDMQRLLFHKFQQAGESLLTRDAAGGTGLGLYISRLITTGMGGKLVLEHSEPGKGSLFSFTLPIATPHRLKTLKQPVAKVDAKSGLTIKSR